MTYQETLEYMFNCLPMYHRVGKAAYKADITNTVALMEHLDNPHKKFRSIHIAGTNGKGSVSHMMASVLKQAGYKVGLYTSPHLVDFRERIRINGQMIPQEAVVAFIESHKAFMQTLQLSFFEMTVGLAFDYFAREKVDVAVVEVGMGGRLDSTNVIKPLMSVITNIGLDHTQFLGNTLGEIAAEKAGIIKDGVPVVIGETHPETRPVFELAAEKHDAPIVFADDNYEIKQFVHKPTLDARGLHFTVHCKSHSSQMEHMVMVSPLEGSYQLKNIATLMQAVEWLPLVGLNIAPQHVSRGIERVVQDTELHGRWQQIGKDPVTICETAHNADGVEAMLGKLKTLPYKKLHLIYGCVNDKDYAKILHMLPRDKTVFYYTQPSVPRGLEVEVLAAKASEIGMSGTAYKTVAEAIEAARKVADKKKDLVLVTGSIFLVADALTK